MNSVEVASMSGHLQSWLQMPKIQKPNPSKCSKHKVAEQQISGGPSVSLTSFLSSKSLIHKFAAANAKLMFSGTCLALVLALFAEGSKQFQRREESRALQQWTGSTCPVEQNIKLFSL